MNFFFSGCDRTRCGTPRPRAPGLGGPPSQDDPGRHLRLPLPTASSASHRPVNRYLLDLPERVELTLVREGDGTVLLGGELDVFLDHGEQTYVDVYRPEPDFVLPVDGDGIAVLPPDFLTGTPASADSRPDVLILRLRTGDRWDYAFLPIYDLNVGFIRGARDTARFELAFDPR